MQKNVFREMESPVIVFHNTGERPFVALPHLHTQVEIYYNIRGGQSFFIDHCFYRCEPYDLFVIPNTQVHKVVVQKNALYERCIINISPRVLSAIDAIPLGASKSAASLFDAIGTERPHKVNLGKQRHRVYMKLISDYNSLEETGSSLELLRQLIQILLFIDTAFAEASQQDEICTPEAWSDKTIQIVEEHLQEEISIKDIAQMLFLSENYLCRVFKSETDMTIGQYVIARRLAEAKRLLYSGSSVREACAKSGFRDYTNFIRTFKKGTGISPSKLERLNEPI